ncbi:TonB-dependent receptor [Nitrospirillum sp. BR 11828]|uniref:TonB-dependent receptor n=1 Tax=Nitrospirillum sp. BR 11828 TaxID=3104325 RepID=UPI002ACA7904|nr:TonB-dependent receptor [Nitrospirillum sp. BR 11828]MDZ5649187.1 TonB-dependent receptor [Nitrospirillum sp. BR 11828]
MAFRYPFLVAWAVLFLVPLVPAGAARASAPDRAAWDLPAGSVETSLRRLAERAGLPLAVRPDDVAGRTAAAVSGAVTLEEALRRLCGPLALECRVASGGILVSRAAPAAAAAVSPPPSVLPVEPLDAPEVIVTGRRGVLPLSRLDLSYSISVQSNATLRGVPRSDGGAALLAAIPGVWADTSAGVAANTMRVRGMPLDGYNGVAVLEDGLPVQQDSSLPWADVDQYFRLDETVDRVEYVRGGPSSVFASNAVGGTLNLITRAPAQPTQVAAVTVSDRGLRRFDGYVGGPLGTDGAEDGVVGGGWSAALGGYWSRNAGVRDHVSNLDGGQVRLSLAHDLPTGTLRFNVRRQDDATFNTSSMPLLSTADGVTGVSGFDPLYGSWFGSDLRTLTLKDGNGSRQVPFGHNNVNRLTAGTMLWDQDVDEDTRLAVKARLRRSDTWRYSIASSGAAMTAGDMLATLWPQVAAAYPGADRTTLRYAKPQAGDGPIPLDSLVARVAPTEADIGISEAILDVSLSGRRLLWGETHDVTAGLYAAGDRMDYRRHIASALVQARSQGRLLDVVAVDAAGRVLSQVTDGGVLNENATYEHTAGDTGALALYLADEWQLAPDWRLDLGIRQERQAFSGVVEGVQTVDVGGAAALADNAVAQGTGQYQGFGRHYDATAVSAGLSWRAAEDTGLFLRGTRTFRDPGIGSFRNTVTPDGLVVQRVSQAELGVSHETVATAAYATLFWNDFDNISFGDQYTDASGALVRRRLNAQARTVGVELEGSWRPLELLSVSATATLQDPRFAHYVFHDTLDDGGQAIRSFDGNLPRRIPRVMTSLRPQLTLADGAVSLEADWRFLGSRYGDDANTLALPAVHLLGATLTLRPRDGVEVIVRGSNLTNALAIMQGDANAGEIVASRNGGLVTARALPGRAVEVTLRLSR